MTRLRLVLALSVVAGCNEDHSLPAPFPDLSMAAASDQALPTIPDLLAPVDEARPQPDLAPPCLVFSIAPVRAFFEMLDTTKGVDLWMGAAVRLKVSSTLNSSCGAVGDLQLAVQGGNATDFVAVTLRQWSRPPRGGVDCDTVSEQVRVVPLGIKEGVSSPNIIIQDASPGSPSRLEVKVGPPPMGANCNVAMMLGGACQYSCQCQAADPRALCIPVAKDQGVCAISCSEDVDCPAQLPHCNDSAKPPFTCTAMPPPNCPNVRLCARQLFDAKACLCSPPPANDKPCRCWDDCADYHYICDGMACRIPCATVRDCPPGYQSCDGACRH